MNGFVVKYQDHLLSIRDNYDLLTILIHEAGKHGDVCMFSIVAVDFAARKRKIFKETTLFNVGECVHIRYTDIAEESSAKESSCDEPLPPPKVSALDLEKSLRADGQRMREFNVLHNDESFSFTLPNGSAGVLISNKSGVYKIDCGGCDDERKIYNWYREELKYGDTVIVHYE